MKNKKKRVLFIMHMPPPITGAALVGEYIKNSKMINDLYDCDYINLSTTKDIQETLRFPIRKILRAVRSFIKTFYKLATVRYDSVYMTLTAGGGGFMKDICFVTLCKLFRRRLVFHLHNKGFSFYKDKFPYNYLMPFAYNNSKVILLSWNLYSDIEDLVPKNNVVICHNGIPEIGIDFIKKENKDAPNILFLSHLQVEKGALLLLDALQDLKEQGIVFTCTYIGGESQNLTRDTFNTEILQRGLMGLVRYEGKKYGKDKEPYWDNADIFVLPTYRECYPLVLVEAMQHSLPCIASNEGGISDIIENNETGLLCQKGDKNDLVFKLKTLLLDSDLRNRFGLAGYNKYKQELTIDQFEHRLKECLDCCIISK